MNPPVAKLSRKTVIPGCCDSFKHHINRKCDLHQYECPDDPIRFYTNYAGNPEFGIPHTDGLSYYVIHFCPWCGAPLEPIAAAAVDGFVKYTLMYSDCLGGPFIGIVNNADIRWGKSGLPHFPKYIPDEEYQHLFGVTFGELEDCRDMEVALQLLKERCPKIPFDTHINV